MRLYMCVCLDREFVNGFVCLPVWKSCWGCSWSRCGVPFVLLPFVWVSVDVCGFAHGNAADWMPSQGLQEWTVIPNPLNASCPTGDAAVAVPSGTKSHPRKGKGGSNKVRVNSDVVVPPPPPLSPPTHLPLRPRPCFAPTMIASGVHVT